MIVAFDLDDTLYHEMDYVRSAYKAIAHIYGTHLLPLMMKAPSPAKAFDLIGVEIDKLLKIYRTHEPDISLSVAAIYTLVTLLKKGHALALITDGRTVTQEHKIKALGLDRLINADMIYISEKFGEEKISGGAMKDIMRKYPNERYVYVGDNPAKDFVSGNEMGWETICLKATSDNVLQQNFCDFEDVFLPKHFICNLFELIDCVDKIDTIKI